MRKIAARVVALTLACSLALAPVPSAAVAPLLLLLIKQIAKDAAQSMLKDMVLSTLNGMGCKGIAIANALQALDVRKGAGGAGAMPGWLGGPMPKMPSAAGMPGMPAGVSMPGPGGAVPGMAGLAAMGPGAAGSDEMMARMQSMMPAGGSLPAGAGIDPEQMARVMQAMSQPLSPPETLAVIDEMTAIGFLPKAIQAELKECMVLLPAAAPALGLGMGMMKTMLPQLRSAREQLHALSPAEQDELAAALAPEMKALGAEERKTFLEFLDGGFFPKRVADGLRAGL
jgi:hypothetical protein